MMKNIGENGVKELVDTRIGDEIDDTPVLITKGLLLQLIRRTDARLKDCKSDQILQGKVISGVSYYPDGASKLEYAYLDE